MDQSVRQKTNEFFKGQKFIKYKKGDIIIRPDDPIFGIYLITKGFVRQYAISEEGDEVTINLFRPQAFIPMMIVLSGTDNKYYFEAASDVEAFRAPTEKTLEFLKSQPEVLLDLTKRFAQGLIGLSQRIENLMFEDASTRINSLLNYLTGRFGEKQGSQILINLPLSHKDIAAWANLTRETTSRQLERLTKEGIITYSNHFITVLKPTEIED